MNHHWIARLLAATVMPGVTSAAVRTVDDDLLDLPFAQFTAIQDAIDAADDGDIILVYPGDYTGIGDEVVNLLGKAITLRSVHGADVTIIRGEGVRRGITCNSGETEWTSIEGLTVLNGIAMEGGGFFCDSQSSPSLSDCTFTACLATSGGGVFCGSQSSPTLTNCLLSDNAAVGTPGAGGAMGCVDGSRPVLTECTLSGSISSRYGGGLYVRDAQPTLSGTDIIGNIATSKGGGVYWTTVQSRSGGGETGGFAGSISDCDILENNATISGGGLHAETASFNLERVVFTRNSTQGGGGVCFWYSSPTLTDCRIVGNIGVGPAAEGGGMSCHGTSAPNLYSCIIARNTVDGNGGGLGCYYGAVPVLIDCTLHSNMATGLGGGIRSDNSMPWVWDSLICGNAPEQVYGPWSHSDTLVEHTCWPTCPDATQDGVVDVHDLLHVLERWSSTDAAGDMDDNGIVDLLDLAAVIDRWGSCW